MNGREQREHEEQLAEAEEQARRRGEQVAGKLRRELEELRALTGNLQAEVGILRSTLSGTIERSEAEREDLVATINRLRAQLAGPVDSGPVEELLGCPACGVPPESLREDGRPWEFVGCETSGCWIAGTRVKVPRSTWNKRATGLPAPPPAPAEEEQAPRPIEWAWSIPGLCETHGPFEDRDEAAVDGADWIRRKYGEGSLELGICRWVNGADYLPTAEALVELMNDQIDEAAHYDGCDPAFGLPDAPAAEQALGALLREWFSTWVGFAPRWEFDLVETVHVGPWAPRSAF